MKNISLPESDYQVVKLSDNFYQFYDINIYKELLYKQSRPYNCLLFQTHYDYFICVPYRTEIKHDNSFVFKNSKRSYRYRSGLDYSKIVIIKNYEFISDEIATIDSDEYKETYHNIDTIKLETLKYVEDYIKHFCGKKKMSNSMFKKKYGYSTLKYFHKELGLE